MGDISLKYLRNYKYLPLLSRAKSCECILISSAQALSSASVLMGSLVLLLSIIRYWRPALCGETATCISTDIQRSDVASAAGRANDGSAHNGAAAWISTPEIHLVHLARPPQTAPNYRGATKR
jgi:hypothetical protein